MAQYLANGDRLRDAVNAYRATKEAARAEARSDASHACPSEAPPLQSPTGVGDCNKPTKPKRKSYRLPPLDRPSEIPGFPLHDPAGPDGEAKEIPTYPATHWAPAPSTRATQAERRGKHAPLKTTGPSSLRKKPK
jgi:hypothetical protein